MEKMVFNILALTLWLLSWGRTVLVKGIEVCMNDLNYAGVGSLWREVNCDYVV